MPSETIVCAKCTSVLDKSVIAGVEVDSCPTCGGLWLDQGEIARLARMPDDELADLRVRLAGAGGPPPVPCETTQSCLACPGKLREVALGPIKIDYCLWCHGLFLDRGEFDQAVALLREHGGGEKQVLALAAKSMR
jgi:Zn-finger nucleic acid-binding protein